jgi:AraC family transcriptional regulator
VLLQVNASLRPPGLPYGADPPADASAWPGSGLPLEAAWRNIVALDDGRRAGTAVLASRWIDRSFERRRAEATAPTDRHVLAIALRRTRIRLSADRRELFDGVMAAGTVQMTGPGQTLAAEFDAPCDFIHLYLPRHVVTADGMAVRLPDPGDCILHDPLAAQLARSLADTPHAREPLYAESIARTLLLRLAAHQGLPPSTCPLPKWRLKRVHEYLEANLSEAVSLADLARAAGLSRSYFAAQFRATTGYRPHDYIVGQRVEHAKAMLAKGDTPLVEIALAVGFQTQAHFSTVFKRCTGTTPGRWRLAHLERS